VSRDKTFPDLGQVVFATRLPGFGPAPARVLGPLTVCVALASVGSGVAFPVLARRLDSLGAGVGALGLMTAAFALAQFVFSPLLGSLADRIGRRPVLFLALAGSAAANVALVFVPSATGVILIHSLQGVLEAGLVPSTLGAVAAVAPEERRAGWVGLVMGGMGMGLVAGPVLGGLLHDRVSPGAPFLAAAACAGLGLLLALAAVPETRTLQVRRREALERRWAEAGAAAPEQPSLRESLPSPLSVFAALLAIDFAVAFAYGFIQPQLIFHVYHELGWSTARFGLLAGAYGLSMVLGQVALGRLGDRWGRRPVVFAGTVLFGTMFFGIAFLRTFPSLVALACLGGLGNALVMTALSTLYLDLTPLEHRSRVMGIKRAASSLGAVAGPLLVAAVADLLRPRGVFLSAGALVGATALLSLLALRDPGRLRRRDSDVDQESEELRALAAQSTLRGIVLKADVVVPRRRRLV
jgi:MFS family permease